MLPMVPHRKVPPCDTKVLLAIRSCDLCANAPMQTPTRSRYEPQLPRPSQAVPPLVTDVDATSWFQNGKDWEGKNTYEHVYGNWNDGSRLPNVDG